MSKITYILERAKYIYYTLDPHFTTATPSGTSGTSGTTTETSAAMPNGLSTGSSVTPQTTTTNVKGTPFAQLNPSSWSVGDAFTASLAKLAVTIAIAAVVVSAMAAVAVYGISREKGAAKDLIISKLVIVAVIGGGLVLLDAVLAVAIALF